MKPLFSFGKAAILPQLLWRLRDYDIVHLHYPFFGSAELVAMTRFLKPKSKFLLYYHMDTKASGIKGLLFQFNRHAVLPMLLSLAEEITCSSFDYVENSDAGSYYQRNAKKFKEVPFGVDPTFYMPGSQRSQGTEQVVLFVGALIKQNYFKGLENLLVAFERIKHRVGNCQLRIVGRGDMEEYYHSLAAELGILESIEFINDADDKRLVECYQQCYLMVLPSIDTSEAFGIVLLEAMACGKPVVASNLPGVRSIFENEKHGLLVEPGNVDDLVEKICALLADEEMARCFGEAGRKLVESRYSWARAGETLDMIYSQVQNMRA